MSFYSKISLLTLLFFGPAFGMSNPVLFAHAFAFSAKYNGLGMAIWHGTVLMHELGHKYVGQTLMDIPGKIDVGFFKGRTLFDFSNANPNNITHAKIIATLAAGPMAGSLAGLAAYKSAKFVKKDFFLKLILKSYGALSIFGNAINLLPFGENWDGNKILIFSKAWLNNEPLFKVDNDKAEINKI